MANRPIEAHEFARFPALAEKMMAFMQSSENNGTSINTLTAFEKSLLYCGLVDISLVYGVRVLSSLSSNPRAGKLYANEIYVVR